MNDKDRIRLAEAIGGPVWEAYINPGKHPELIELPDPDTDVNDDYAILEWMRRKGDLPPMFTKALFAAWNYKIGDYARAALKVINQTLPPKETMTETTLKPDVNENLDLDFAFRISYNKYTR